jgi:hypothetical protein
LRDGPPTTNPCEGIRLEPQELDEVVAFIRILLEWDDRERTFLNIERRLGDRPW